MCGHTSHSATSTTRQNGSITPATRGIIPGHHLTKFLHRLWRWHAAQVVAKRPSLSTVFLKTPLTTTTMSSYWRKMHVLSAIMQARSLNTQLKRDFFDLLLSAFRRHQQCETNICSITHCRPFRLIKSYRICSNILRRMIGFDCFDQIGLIFIALRNNLTRISPRYRASVSVTSSFAR